MKLRISLKTELIGVLIFLIANILYLDYISFRVPSLKNSYESTKTSPDQQVSKDNKIVDSCYPYSCVDLIKLATASIPLKSVQNPNSAVPSITREYYIPFGGGETNSDQYEDISGLQAYIDTTKYGNIKKVTFETSLRIPTANGTVYVQLFNATDNHPVWYSEISSEGNRSRSVVSLPITLEKGNKLYKIQAKTTLRYQSIIDLARIHIITDE